MRCRSSFEVLRGRDNLVELPVASLLGKTLQPGRPVHRRTLTVGQSNEFREAAPVHQPRQSGGDRQRRPSSLVVSRFDTLQG